MFTFNNVDELLDGMHDIYIMMKHMPFETILSMPSTIPLLYDLSYRIIDDLHKLSTSDNEITKDEFKKYALSNSIYKVFISRDFNPCLKSLTSSID